MQDVIREIAEKVDAIQGEGEVVFGSLVPNTNGKGYVAYRLFTEGTNRYVSKSQYPEVASAVARGERIRELKREAIRRIELLTTELKKEIGDG